MRYAINTQVFFCFTLNRSIYSASLAGVNPEEAPFRASQGVCERTQNFLQGHGVSPPSQAGALHPGGGDPRRSSWGTKQMPCLLVGPQSVLTLEAAGDGKAPPAGSARSWKVLVPFSTALHPPGTPDCSGPHLPAARRPVLPLPLDDSTKPLWQKSLCEETAQLADVCKCRVCLAVSRSLSFR